MKCRLRLENDTRWGSGYLLLEVIEKAFERGLFKSESNDELQLPVSIKTIRMYLMILGCLYNLNISLQSNSCSIADLIPAILSARNLLEKMKDDVSVHCEQYIDLLIQEIDDRFSYELNSGIYQVNCHSSYLKF
jgi:hypothetical protein